MQEQRYKEGWQEHSRRLSDAAPFHGPPHLPARKMTAEVLVSPSSPSREAAFPTQDSFTSNSEGSSESRKFSEGTAAEVDIPRHWIIEAAAEPAMFSVECLPAPE
ncbi:hypothetical protein E2C01_009475 [Portunus trituberculatus]|uniref:Uncharacterized protein n=1 Tax=Portunus trituberculatus TaxID=210409 RepID=A0A5B7D5W1_PORTR|nr:hypothetical protein [Portunus trituberculatus]